MTKVEGVLLSSNAMLVTMDMVFKRMLHQSTSNGGKGINIKEVKEETSHCRKYIKGIKDKFDGTA